MRSGGAFRAVVLCAGRGERLRPLTDDRPKCLVTLAGRALLDWQLEALRAAGAAETGAVVGWQGHRVERPGLTRFWNDRWHDTTMVASLLAAAPWLEAGPCIAVYGDIVFHPDAVRTLAACPYDIAIAYDRSWRALWSARFARPEYDAETLRVVAGEVAEIGGRVDHLERVEGQYMGLVRTTPAGFARVRALRTALPPGEWDAFDMTSLLAELVRRGVSVGAVAVSGRWCEVDHPADLECYEERLRAAPGWSHDWRISAGRVT